ncbi:hypothetical protein HLB23_06650 [Nocardia uniformis]|uniref:Uncharacterized protein n=1 Tax=Nocardia uniformis TaxID=53432 RepID=A0A849C3K2_9NOCA|nr:hypothetical protein [Nocardia uniformis]NNH69549.1 hypothetical protein [Nocardia uniformis]
MKKLVATAGAFAALTIALAPVASATIPLEPYQPIQAPAKAGSIGTEFGSSGSASEVGSNSALPKPGGGNTDTDVGIDTNSAGFDLIPD